MRISAALRPGIPKGAAVGPVRLGEQNPIESCRRDVEAPTTSRFGSNVYESCKAIDVSTALMLVAMTRPIA